MDGDMGVVGFANSSLYQKKRRSAVSVRANVGNCGLWVCLHLFASTGTYQPSTLHSRYYVYIAHPVLLTLYCSPCIAHPVLLTR